MVYFKISVASILNDESGSPTCFQKLKLFIWRMIGYPLLFPMAWWQGRLEQLWTPADVQMVMVALVLNFCVPSADTYTDTKAGIDYLLSGDPWYGILTLSVPFLPFLVRLALETKSTLSLLWEDFPLLKSIWRDLLTSQAIDTASMLPYVAPLKNLSEIQKLTTCKDGQKEAQEIQLKMGSHSNWEPYMESGPQILIQLYIWLKEGLKKSAIISTFFSLLSLGLACGGTLMIERVDYPVANALLPKLFLAVLFAPVIVPRTFNIAILCYTCNNSSLFNGGIGKVVLVGMVFLALFLRPG